MRRMTSGYSLDALTPGAFRDNLGGLFRLAVRPAPGGSPFSVDLRLADVAEHGKGSATFRASFSVVFHGPLAPILPQGIYRLEHDGLGALDLFIVPLGPDQPSEPAAMRYEAVFG